MGMRSSAELLGIAPTVKIERPVFFEKVLQLCASLIENRIERVIYRRTFLAGKWYHEFQCFTNQQYRQVAIARKLELQWFLSSLADQLGKDSFTLFPAQGIVQ